jgi:hypothetical protein
MPDTSNDEPQDSPSSETEAATESTGQVREESGNKLNWLILQGTIFLLTQRR